MKRFLVSLLVVGCFILPLTSYASGDIYNMDIKNAMKLMPEKVKNELDDFKFYFGKDSKPLTSSVIGTIHTSTRTNGFLKSYQKSCNWVFYSALINLGKKAKAMGGNGVANIESNWENNPTSSNETYVCVNGFLMSGVALKGDVIK